MTQGVERYRKPTRILHLIHLSAFVVLFLTGLILFIPPLGFLAQDSWTRVIHRIAAVVFIIAPLIYLIRFPRASWQGIKDAFSWGAEDIGWLRAAPRYYFLTDEKGMPPQGHMNTGQKMWWFMVIVFGVVFVITGAFLWFAKVTAPAALLQWMVFVHDIAFIVTGLMFFVHLHMSVLHPIAHPLRTGPWNSMMAGGTVSVEYAKAKHAKWYDSLSKSRKARSP